MTLRLYKPRSSRGLGRGKSTDIYMEYLTGMEISGSPSSRGDNIYERPNGFTSEVAPFGELSRSSNSESESESHSELSDEMGVYELYEHDEMEYESQWIDIIH